MLRWLCYVYTVLFMWAVVCVLCVWWLLGWCCFVLGDAFVLKYVCIWICVRYTMLVEIALHGVCHVGN